MQGFKTNQFKIVKQTFIAYFMVWSLKCTTDNGWFGEAILSIVKANTQHLTLKNNWVYCVTLFYITFHCVTLFASILKSKELIQVLSRVLRLILQTWEITILAKRADKSSCLLTRSSTHPSPGYEASTWSFFSWKIKKTIFTRIWHTSFVIKVVERLELNQ